MAGNQQKFQQFMNDGHSAAWDQHWDQAAVHYRAAVEEFPENASALVNLGLALFELSQFEEAARVYKKAATLAPEDPAPYEKLMRIFERLGHLNEAVKAGMRAAELHLKTKDVEKSIDSWMRVTMLQPENMTAHARLAMIYERLGKKPEAVSEYLISASLLQHAGDPKKAEQVVLYALKLLPGSAEATQSLHLLKNNQMLQRPLRPRGGTGPVRMAEVRQLKPSGDENPFEHLDPIAEARQKALIQLAGLLFEQPENQVENTSSPRRGINSLVRGTGGLPLDQNDQTMILLHLSQAIESQTHGQDNQAVEELQRAVGVGLSHPALHFDLGMLLVDRDPKEAQKYLLKSVKHPEFSLASYLLKGRINYIAGNYQEAALDYLQALRVADTETVPADQADELTQMYEPVIEAQVHNQESAQQKALCETIASQLERGDWRGFLRRARKQLPEQAPNSPPMPLSEMLLESRSGQVVEAMAHIRQLVADGKTRSAMEEAFFALDYAPTYLPLHVQIGDLLLKESRTKEALTKYMLVSQLYSLRGEAAQAINLLKRVTRLAPMNLAVHNRLIELLTDQGRFDEAIEQYIQLAQLYYQMADLDLARQTYLSALRMVQQSSRNRQWAYEVLNALADLDMQRLDWRQALRFNEQMRTLRPEEPLPRNRIIDLNFRLGQDQAAYTELENYIDLLENQHRLAEAASFTTALLEDQPGKLELRRYLAEIYTRLKDFEKAVIELDILAEGYAQSGNVEAAIRSVEQILKLNPPNRADYEQVLQKLRG